jgi:glycosyltransferase involved in cell wall biosynthesis
MRTLLGLTANNPHTQHLALALHEAGLLDHCLVPLADTRWPAPLRPVRRWIERRHPALDARLRARRLDSIPRDRLLESPAWELLRLAADKLVKSPRLTDLLWEKGEHAFARNCARRIARDRPDIFIGVEHGCLEALAAARRAGALGGLIQLSAHHAFRERALAPVLARYPGAESPASRTLRAKAARRDARRDAELASADFIHANSAFTARTLVAAGADPARILTVPLGAPEPAGESVLREELRAGSPHTFLFAGNGGLHKGLPLLLSAWPASRPPPGASLRLYGRVSPAAIPRETAGVELAGVVPRAELWRAMRQAGILVFPTLCDGFGMVVTEALAQGLPVLATDHCGAADLIHDGVNGFIVPAGDEAALADRLDWCHRHPRELEAMRPAARAAAASWSWAHYRRALADGLLGMLPSLRR